VLHSVAAELAFQKPAAVEAEAFQKPAAVAVAFREREEEAAVFL
jgi:hypothetical protein